MYACISLSLSLYIYIYIYICILDYYHLFIGLRGGLELGEVSALEGTGGELGVLPAPASRTHVYIYIYICLFYYLA